MEKDAGAINYFLVISLQCCMYVYLTVLCIVQTKLQKREFETRTSLKKILQ